MTVMSSRQELSTVQCVCSRVHFVTMPHELIVCSCGDLTVVEGEKYGTVTGESKNYLLLDVLSEALSRVHETRTPPKLDRPPPVD